VVDLSAGYQPPGVYVQTESTGTLAAVGVGATVVCVVGDGVGYETNTENVSFAHANSVTLTKQYVVPGSIVVTAVTDTGLTTFVADTTSPAATHDYGVSTSNTTHLTTISRETTGAIPTDRLVTVTYQYADDSYYGLNKFSDFGTLSQVYGPSLDPVTGAIASPLTFAAEQAWRNGANVIYAVAIDPRPGGSRAAQFKAAYQKILPNYEINLVVPLWTDVVDTASATAFLTDLSSFLNTAYDEGFPMMGICGVMGSYATTDPDTLATAVANRRVVLMWPQQLSYFNSILNSTTQADGIYLAAAAAGVLADQGPSRGLTRSQIRGFTAVPAALLNSMTTSRKDTWASKGVSIVEPNRTGQLVVRHGLTTDVSDVGNSEISIVRCQDTLLETIQLSLEGAELIGDPITQNTPLMVQSLIMGALENAITETMISSYSDVIVLQESTPGGSPTVIDVTFSYVPVYMLNYITVNFTLDLTTNTLTLSTTTTTPAP
jgi:hypothetical protein